MVKKKIFLFLFVCVVFSLFSAQVLADDCDRWLKATPMSTARFGAQSTVIGGNIYVTGGATRSGGAGTTTLEVFDIISNIWQTKTSMNTARQFHASAEYDGKLYVFGGHSSGVNTLSSVEVYDPTTDSWTYKNAMPNSAYQPRVISIGNYMYVAIKDELYSYYPDEDSWELESDLPFDRWNYPFGLAYSEGKIYFVGTGAHGSGAGPVKVYIYNIEYGTWSNGATLDIERSIQGVALYNGKIYGLGGNQQRGVPATESPEVPVYDISTDSWVNRGIADFDVSRTHLPAVAPVTGDSMYVIGGWNGYSPQTVVEYYKFCDKPEEPDPDPTCGDIPTIPCTGATWIDYPICQWDESTCEPDPEPECKMYSYELKDNCYTEYDTCDRTCTNSGKNCDQCGYNIEKVYAGYVFPRKIADKKLPMTEDGKFCCNHYFCEVRMWNLDSDEGKNVLGDPGYVVPTDSKYKKVYNNQYTYEEHGLYGYHELSYGECHQFTSSDLKPGFNRAYGVTIFKEITQCKECSWTYSCGTYDCNPQEVCNWQEHTSPIVPSGARNAICIEDVTCYWQPPKPCDEAIWIEHECVWDSSECASEDQRFCEDFHKTIESGNLVVDGKLIGFIADDEQRDEVLARCGATYTLETDYEQATEKDQLVKITKSLATMHKSNLGKGVSNSFKALTVWQILNDIPEYFNVENDRYDLKPEYRTLSLTLVSVGMGGAGFVTVPLGLMEAPLSNVVHSEFVEPTDDATVVRQNLLTNYGSEEKLELKRSGGLVDKEAFMKFDLSDLDNDDLRMIEEAQLYIYARSTSGNDVKLHVEAAKNNWDEDDVAYANRPTHWYVGGQTDSELTDEWNWHVVDIKQDLKNPYYAMFQDEFSYAFSLDTTGEAEIYSSESEYSPLLFVRYRNSDELDKYLSERDTEDLIFSSNKQVLEEGDEEGWQVGVNPVEDLLFKIKYNSPEPDVTVISPSGEEYEIEPEYEVLRKYRRDDGEMDESIGIKKYYEHDGIGSLILKELDLEKLDEDVYAKLFVYGSVIGCTNESQETTGIRVNTKYVHFDPCAEFTEEFEWKSIDIPTEYLKEGSNTFRIMNWGPTTVHVGYDTDTTEYGQSKRGEIYDGNRVIYDEGFEAMMYLDIYKATGDHLVELGVNEPEHGDWKVELGNTAEEDIGYVLDVYGKATGSCSCSSEIAELWQEIDKLKAEIELLKGG